jgi:hypothetical protein
MCLAMASKHSASPPSDTGEIDPSESLVYGEYCVGDHLKAGEAVHASGMHEFARSEVGSFSVLCVVVPTDRCSVRVDLWRVSCVLAAGMSIPARALHRW